MVNPDLELREGGEGGFFVACLLPAFLPSVILFFFFFSFNKGGKFLKKLWCCVGGRV